jgi:hypothetical protein
MNDQTNGTSSIFVLSLDDASRELLAEASLLVSQAENSFGGQSDTAAAPEGSGTWKEIEDILSF